MLRVRLAVLYRPHDLPNARHAINLATRDHRRFGLFCEFEIIPRQWSIDARELRWREIEAEPEPLLEQVFDGFASTLEYLGCTLDGANPDVLSSLCGAFAQVARSVDRMQCHQVSGGFPCSFSCAADAFCSALADISSATAHIMFSAGLSSGFRLGAARVLRGIRCLRDGDPADADC